jgi:O-methyltransferase involved in polyketide biosynthesis
MSDTTNRNYSTISPSALSLLLMKGHTNIPFAKEAAELMMLPEKYEPDFNNREIGYWARVLHFENRYWSIDQLLSDIPIRNILELSSGYSLRGLEMVQRNSYHYIDTDLPAVIAAKQKFTAEIQGDAHDNKGTLEILPLNALDEQQFNEIISHFPKDETIAIINEGLLMYLGIEEKKKLCNTIHKILKEHGGYWITADIYVKREMAGLEAKMTDKERAFFEQHHIEDNKFESFEDAEAFFKEAGFVIDEEAVPNPAKLSSLQYLQASATSEQRAKFGQAPKVQATWRLRAV